MRWKRSGHSRILGTVVGFRSSPLVDNNPFEHSNSLAWTAVLSTQGANHMLLQIPRKSPYYALAT